MTHLAPVIEEIINRIEVQFDGVISNLTAWEFTTLAVAAFLPDYVTVDWDSMKLGLFDPLSGVDDNNPKSIHRLKQMTVADVKAVVVSNATYQR